MGNGFLLIKKASGAIFNYIGKGKASVPIKGAIFAGAAAFSGISIFNTCQNKTPKPPDDNKKDTLVYVKPVEVPRTFPVLNNMDVKKLAGRFNMSPEKFKEISEIEGNKVFYQDTLKVPHEEIETTFYALAKKYNVSVDYLHRVLNPQIYNPEQIGKGELINVPFEPFKEPQTLDKLFPNYAKALKNIYNDSGLIEIKGKTFPTEVKGIKFTEFMISNTAMEKDYVNVPDVRSMKNIENLVEKVLLPVQNHFNKPVEISSGFRGPRLNKLVGGVPNSQHALGEACDFTVKDVDIKELYIWCKQNLKYDQLILEYDNWVHVSYKPNAKNRQKAFVIEDKNKNKK